VSYKFNPFTGTLDDVGPNGGAGVPGGSTTQVQFNDGGVFGGDVDLTWDKTTNVLGVAGDINLSDGGTYTTTLQTITPTANRTISFPDATGTVALVAGSSGQLVYNNAGANAGVSTLTFDGTSVTLAGRLINSYTSLASSPAKVFTGTWFTGGTSTTTKPHFLIEPTGTTSTAWSTSGTGLGVNAASGFAGRLFDFQVNGSSRAVLDSSGRLLVGTSSVVGTTYAGSNKFQLHDDGVAGAQIFTHRSTGSEYPAILELARSRGSLASPTAVIANDKVGACVFHGYDGANYIRTAAIDAVIDGTPGANDMPGSLVFSTTADGAASPTERMRISQSGMCSINTTLAENSAYFDGKLRVVNSGTGSSFSTTGSAAQLVQTQWHQATTGDNGFTVFGTEASFTLRGSISYNRAGGVVAYNTTSDYRAKTILGDIEDPGSTIDALRIYRGVMNGATVERPMLIAHEAQEVAPYCVTGEKDAVDGDGNPIYQQMDHQVLVPLLIAEIQQLRARVAALETA
jgi:hypothetical protein